MTRSSLLVLGLAAIALAIPSAAVASTQQVTFTPFNSAGKIAIPTQHVKRGECFSSSLVAARPDALRCLRGNQLQDPCFKAPKSRRLVVCVYRPSSVGVLLKVPRIPKKRNPNLHTAWAVTVAAGECPFIAGATTDTPHGRGNYACPGRLYLYGDPIPQDPSWMIWGGYDPMAADAQLLPINTVWY